MRGLLMALPLAALLAVPAVAATDTSSLAAFVKSCNEDVKACRSLTLNAVHSARNAKYGCIPESTSPEDAADRLLTWLRSTANNDPKYKDQPLEDLMWTGIDETWPCKK
jgi:hypothetical protein